MAGFADLRGRVSTSGSGRWRSRALGARRALSLTWPEEVAGAVQGPASLFPPLWGGERQGGQRARLGPVQAAGAHGSPQGSFWQGNPPWQAVAGASDHHGIYKHTHNSALRRDAHSRPVTRLSTHDVGIWKTHTLPGAAGNPCFAPTSATFDLKTGLLASPNNSL